MADPAPAAPPPAPESSGSSSGGKPTLFILLAVINMAVVMGVGVMLYLGQKKKAAEPGIEDVIKGEHEKLKEEEKSKEFIGKLVPLETFLVNISGTRGRKLVKINMELEVTNAEFKKRSRRSSPRFAITLLLSPPQKRLMKFPPKEGKDALREEIKNQINLFLTKGAITKVYFTEFILN